MKKVEAFNRDCQEKSRGKEREVAIVVYLPPAIFKAAEPRNIGAITDNSGTSSAVYVLSKVTKVIAVNVQINFIIDNPIEIIT